MKELRSNSTMNNHTFHVRKRELTSYTYDSGRVELITSNDEKFNSSKVVIEEENGGHSTHFMCGYSWFNRFAISRTSNECGIENIKQKCTKNRFTKSSKFSESPFILLCFLGLFVANCANPIPPTGGDRDTTPPRLITEASTPNLQTNFTKQSIELTFDEWIVLKDKRKNILVSPPLEKGNLEVEISRKTVVVNFPEDEILKTDATYVINFGEAVQDLTENNPAKDLRFVFSTGDVIDSLEVKGEVVDAFTGEPVEETVVMLYRNLADSVVYTERPFYFSKTDENGQFTIGNIKGGSYKIAATQDDLNADYLFSTGEQIAFLAENIEVTDSITTPITLRLFQPNLVLDIQKTLDRSYGKVGLQFNQPPDLDSLEVQYSIPNLTNFTEVEKDTLRIWYDLTDSVKWETYVTYPNEIIDTVKIKAYSRTAFLQKDTLQTTTRLAAAPKSLNPTKSIRLTFNHPLVAVDTNLIQLIEDSTQNVVANYRLDSMTAQRELVIDYNWQDSSLYQLTLLPDALTDLYGLQNDTVQQAYQALSAADFGTIDFKITELDSTQQYVLRLFFKTTNLIDTYIINSVKTWEQSISALPAGAYSIELITDENRNGKWDVGDYDRQQLPEMVQFKTLEEVRANWNVEVAFTPAEL